jgi:PKD repeat protein
MIKKFHDSGVAEIVGSLMLIAIIGLGIAIAGVYLLNHSVPEKIPEFRASLSNTSTNLILQHDGGESIPRSNFKILVNGNPTNYISSNASSPDWSIDETLTFYSYDPATPLPDVKIVYNGSAGERVLADFSDNLPQTIGPTCLTPTVTASGSPLSGNVPLQVQFTGTSTGATPSSWSWNFGDGTTSNLQNPSHTYTNSRVYTVSVTASNECGSSSPSSLTVNVGVCPIPVTSFTVNMTNGCTPLTVQFSDNSTVTPTFWNWTFGDNSGTSTIQNPIHTYTAAGNYTVTLISGNACGSNTSTRTGLVQAYGNVPAPVSEAGGFWYLNEGAGTSASDSSGHLNTGAITSGNWVSCPAPGRGYLSFNGNSAYVSIPNSASLTPANQVSFEAWVYPVEQKTAKVIQKRDWDGHGIDQDTWQGWQGGVTLSDGTKHDVTWSPGGGNRQPALQTWYYVVLTYDGTALRIYVNGVERNSIPLTGTLRQFSAPVIIGSTTSQKYLNGSIANVAMYSRALSKCEIAARYAAFTPQACVPVTNFGATPTSGIPPLTVQFTDISTGTPASWNWNFGDGTTSNLQNPSHVYSAIGDYTVTLTTTNVFGSNTATKAGYIQVTKKAFVNYIIDENVFVYGNKLLLNGNTASGPGATIVITGPLTTSDLNGGAAVDVSTIYIGGDVNLDGGSAGLGSESKPGPIYVNGDLYLGKGARNIYGDVHVARNFYLKDAHINGNVYVNGDLTLDWTPTLSEKTRIYYTGKFNHPATMSKEITDKCIYQATVPGFTMPDQAIPPVKPTEWYDKIGYLSGGDLTSGIKIFTSSYSSTKYRNTAENVVIVASKGDITITGLGGSGVTGVLFAPYGKVTFEGGFFEGVVIARDGFFVTSGGTKVTFVNFAKYFSSPDEYPL